MENFRRNLEEARQTIDSLQMRKARKKVIELLFPLVALIGVFLAILQPIIASSNSTATGDSISDIATYTTFIGDFALYFGIFIVSALAVHFIDSFASQQGRLLRLVHWIASASMFLFLGVIISLLFVLAEVGNNVTQTLEVPVSVESYSFVTVAITTFIVAFAGVYFFEYTALPASET
jgi:hypothetical protein